MRDVEALLRLWFYEAVGANESIHGLCINLLLYLAGRNLIGCSFDWHRLVRNTHHQVLPQLSHLTVSTP